MMMRMPENRREKRSTGSQGSQNPCCFYSQPPPEPHPEAPLHLHPTIFLGPLSSTPPMTSSSTSSSSATAASHPHPHHHLHHPPPPPSSSSSHSHHQSSSSSSSQSQNQSHTQACAACKYQRRKCQPDCILAPYFPADAQRQFLNAHRLFGVSNILKIIRDLDPPRRDEAMHSIIFQSNARAQDPVGGCYRIILDLERQLHHYQRELAVLHHHLHIYRTAHAQQQQQESLLPSFHEDDHENNIINQHQQLHQMQQHPQQQQFYDYFYTDGGGNGEGGSLGLLEDNMNNITIHSNGSNNSVGNYGGAGVVELESRAMLSLQQGSGADDARPLLDVFDVRQFEVPDEKESAIALAAASNKEEERKEEPNAMENVQEHDLKGAASLLTLTNCMDPSI